ncbi:MAG: hypothetical protein GEU75_16940 [Dehalococcoidia bacterium]|nr:hypothetical protein [Dehalococcoidia bacterium]
MPVAATFTAARACALGNSPYTPVAATFTVARVCALGNSPSNACSGDLHGRQSLRSQHLALQRL